MWQAPSGHRLYSSQDVRRLVLIKQLVNKGHAIGMLARVDTARLQDLVSEAELTEATLVRGASRGPVSPNVTASPSVDSARLLIVGVRRFDSTARRESYAHQSTDRRNARRDL